MTGKNVVKTLTAAAAAGILAAAVIGALGCGGKDVRRGGGDDVGTDRGVEYSARAESSNVETRDSAVSSNVTVETDTFTDTRDGQTYRTATIGNLTWMARNLNFETDSSKCHYRSPDSCAIYGIKYKSNMCPAGWRLPSNNDWRALINAVSTDSAIALSRRGELDENDWNTLVSVLDFPVPAENSNWDNYGRHHFHGFLTVIYDTSVVYYVDSTRYTPHEWLGSVSWDRRTMYDYDGNNTGKYIFSLGRVTMPDVLGNIRCVKETAAER